MSYQVEYKYSKRVRLVANDDDLEYYVQVRFLFMWFTVKVYDGTYPGGYTQADKHAEYLASKPLFL
jgi:hypothetical protein